MVKIENLSVSYDDLKVVQGFSYDFHENHITVMCGPSGCGKTTLLNAVAGLVDTKGCVEIEGQISYIFQEDRLLPWMTVYENVAYVLKHVVPSEGLEARVNHYLEMVGLLAVKDDYPDKLSGGMKRRVSIARAFAYPSDVLLMDEPFKGLDKGLKGQIMSDFLKIWSEDKRTVIFVTHDEYEAEYLGTKLLHMDGLPLEIVNERDL